LRHSVVTVITAEGVLERILMLNSKLMFYCYISTRGVK